ncbi:ATP-binding protein [Fontivita pretiosa]|uniref:hybrid sensor histidine kinase/response regulator n=1 Tax=Fontivita pretiosa TaxID=2989684 RepID=UPI003D163F38
MHPELVSPTAAQRDRAARLLHGQKRILEMIATGEPLADILHAITTLIETQSEGIVCSILLLDETGQRLYPAAAASLPEAYNQAIRGVQIGPNVGSCGTAAYLGQRVISPDITTDPKWAAWRELALAYGLRSCWSEPIRSRSGQVLGTFAIYSRQVAEPDNEQLRLIEIAGHLAGIALDRQRADEELRRAKQAAEEASAAKDQFLAVLSHELRTPLTPVLATINLLQQRCDLPADLGPDLAMLHRNVQLQARLIDDLLDLTRIARGKLELRFELSDVHELLRAAVSTCRPEIDAGRLHLRYELSARRHQVWADAARLQQVFWNLLSNAVKFTPPGGSITLRSSNLRDQQRGEWIRVQVIDTGIGIEPRELPRLFGAFEQGQAAAPRRFGGIGLGLTIARTLAQLHGGRLWGQSQGPNRGATFTVELPLHEQQTQTIPQASASPSRTGAAEPRSPQGASQVPAASEGATGELNVLLVDDHADTAQVLARLLRSLGYHVTTASSVAEALSAAEAARTATPPKPFDLLVCDLGLPDGSGLDIVQQLKLKQPIKSIALSGFGMEDDVRRSLEAGFDQHLTKPVDLDVLDAVIRELRSRPQ